MDVNKKPIKALTGYKHNAIEEERCENRGCGRVARGSFYAKNKNGKLLWICTRCARYVDKII
jgi:hypothetical protein